jgi:hypothetical protein
MIGSKNGVVSLFYKHMHELHIQKESIHYHCIIEQQNLIGKDLEFKQMMTDAVGAINFIRSRGLNRQFKAFLDETESEYGNTLFY